MNHPLSDDFGSVPQPSETFGTIPQPSEPFRIVRNPSERTEGHTLTVREVARLFEQAGVSRTERSIINWCQPNRQSVARLDAFFDENERRYYVTPQSVTRAIEEEQAKHPANATRPTSETEVPKRSETESRYDTAEDDRVKELERRKHDLEITNLAKDYHIEHLQKERGQFLDRMIGMSHYVGQLETQVRQLGGTPPGSRSLPNGSEMFGHESDDDSHAAPVEQTSRR